MNTNVGIFARSLSTKWDFRSLPPSLRSTHHSCVSSPPEPPCVRWASSCSEPEQSAETWLPQPNPSAERSDPHDPERGSLPGSITPLVTSSKRHTRCAFAKRVGSSLRRTRHEGVPGIFFVNSTRTWTWLVAISVSRRKFSSALYWSCSCKQHLFCQQPFTTCNVFKHVHRQSKTIALTFENKLLSGLP